MFRIGTLCFTCWLIYRQLLLKSPVVVPSGKSYKAQMRDLAPHLLLMSSSAATRYLGGFVDGSLAMYKGAEVAAKTFGPSWNHSHRRALSTSQRLSVLCLYDAMRELP